MFFATTLFAQAVENVYSAGLGGELIEQKRKDYDKQVAEIEGFRTKLSEQYRSASPQQKKQLLADAREFLEKKMIQEIFPAWYGTDWAFHGTSKVPGEGSIACGYFVSTCLLHAGFDVERIKLAQQASQKIHLAIRAIESLEKYSTTL